MHTGVMDVYVAGISTPHAAVSFNGKLLWLFSFVICELQRTSIETRTTHIVVIDELRWLPWQSLAAPPLHTKQHSTIRIQPHSWHLTFLIFSLLSFPFYPLLFLPLPERNRVWRLHNRCAKYRMARKPIFRNNKSFYYGFVGLLCFYWGTHTLTSHTHIQTDTHTAIAALVHKTTNNPFGTPHMLTAFIIQMISGNWWNANSENIEYWKWNLFILLGTQMPGTMHYYVRANR